MAETFFHILYDNEKLEFKKHFLIISKEIIVIQFISYIYSLQIYSHKL
jgi:hypothetical protein